MNTVYVVAPRRRIQRRGQVWNAGDVCDLAHHMPVWRNFQMAAGNLVAKDSDGRRVEALVDVDILGGTVAEVAEAVKDIDELVILTALQERERAEKGRVGVLGALESRIDELVEGDEE